MASFLFYLFLFFYVLVSWEDIVLIFVLFISFVHHATGCMAKQFFREGKEPLIFER